MDARIALGMIGLALTACSPAETAVSPQPPLVQTVEVVRSGSGMARYTGVIRARTESNLGFRVGGKIFERLVDPGDRVTRGQPLMRLDRTDFSLALNAARASVEAARAQMIKAKADEERSRKLVSDGWTSKQTYDQNKGAADAAIAQFANAEAQASQIANQAGYAELQADADGVVMEVPSEPGQVVAAGQTVVKLARDGAREAEVFLPEGSRRAAQGEASATLYAEGESTYPARLRELSATADPRHAHLPGALHPVGRRRDRATRRDRDPAAQDLECRPCRRGGSSAWRAVRPRPRYLRLALRRSHRNSAASSREGRSYGRGARGHRRGPECG